MSAAGSDVRRSTELVLAEGAGALVRETLVLGRHGEAPGRLTSRTVVRRGEREVLVEELDARDLAPARVLDGVLWVGAAGVGQEVAEVSEPGVTRLETETGEVLHRALATEAHLAAAGVDRVWQSQVGSLLTRGSREDGAAPGRAEASRSGRQLVQGAPGLADAHVSPAATPRAAPSPGHQGVRSFRAAAPPTDDPPAAPRPKVSR